MVMVAAVIAAFTFTKDGGNLNITTTTTKGGTTTTATALIIVKIGFELILHLAS
jgi:hypothetical protein